MTGTAGEDSPVPRILHQYGEPPRFQVQACLDEEIRLAQGFDESRLGIQEMRIFGAFGKTVTLTWSPPISLARSPRSGTVAQT